MMECVKQRIGRTALRFLGGGLCCLVLFGLGCTQLSRGPKVEESAPPVDIRVGYSTGSPLSGPVPIDINALRVEDTYEVTVQFFALEEVPARALEPLHKQIRLVMMSPRANFVAPVSRLTPGARAALREVDASLLTEVADGAWGHCIPAGRKQAVLPRHVTTMVEVESAVTASAQGNRLRLLLARRSVSDPNDPNVSDPNAENLEIALVRSGFVPPSLELQPSFMEAPADANAQPVLITERVVLLPVPLGERRDVALLIPFAWKSPWAQALGLFVTVERLVQPPATEQLEAFAQCVTTLMRHEVDLRSIHGESATWAGCLSTLEQLIWPAHWRSALVYLATTTHVPLAGDLALAAPPSLAQTLAHNIYEACTEQPVRDMSDLGWRVEKAAYRLLLDTANDDSLTPALWYLLQRHAGQMSQQRPTLREQVAESRDLADLERRLINENRISLEDMSPAARTRAYEWLRQRELAPAGYDPLASAKERRAALDKVSEESTK